MTSSQPPATMHPAPFGGFAFWRVETRSGPVFVRCGGAGPAVLLVHRIPETPAPLLALWSGEGGLASWYVDVGGPLGLWRTWAEDVSGEAVAGGHFFPEEHPAETADRLSAFLLHEAAPRTDPATIAPATITKEGTQP